MLVWIFGFLGQELAPKFRLNLLSAFWNFSPSDPFDLIRKKKKQYLCLIVIKSINWPSCDPHLCRLWGPSNFFKHKCNETGLADAGLNFYLQLIRREHFDISHLTPSLSVCSSNPFSGKSDSIQAQRCWNILFPMWSRVMYRRDRGGAAAPSWWFSL